MPEYTEITTSSVAGIEPNCVVFVKKVTTVLRDGEPFGQPQIWRGPLSPGDDLTGQDPLVIKVCTALWTPEVVAAFAASRAAPPSSVPQ